MHNTSISANILYDCETWFLRGADVKKALVPQAPLSLSHSTRASEQHVSKVDFRGRFFVPD